MPFAVIFDALDFEDRRRNQPEDQSEEGPERAVSISRLGYFSRGVLCGGVPGREMAKPVFYLFF